MRPIVLPLLLLLTAGCATYEFDLVEPADLRAHVGRKATTTVPVDPLVYRLRAAEGRLVMWIDNPTSDPIQLVGERSTVVDPRGESHPVVGRTIAPGSFVKLIFPPLRPRLERVGPTFGVGVGVGVSDARRYGRRELMGIHDPWDDGPRYAVVYDDSRSLYYDWKGEAAIRVSLFFARDPAPTTGPAGGAGADAQGRTFRHEFTFQRRKV